MPFAVIVEELCIKSIFSHFRSPEYTPMLLPSLYQLSGALSMGLFIHNAIITIVSTNAKPQNNVRDISIAFCLVCITYMTIGIVYYICFPLAKDCIADVRGFQTLAILSCTLNATFQCAFSELPE